MVFEKKKNNFGVIQGNKKVKANFKFKNAGTNPLIIYDVRTGCGCTVAYWNKNPIQVNAMDSIIIIFDSNHKKDYQKKDIAIYSNTTEDVTFLSVEGVVKELTQ